MKNRLRQLILSIGMFLLLSGCAGQSGEDFYALPQLPEDYLSLRQTINGEMNSLGAEYAAPASGSNTQNIQLQDLDGDGVRECALAFFRVASAEKPLKIYIFTQNQITGDYQTSWVIEGDGTGIYSIAFENLGGTSAKEIIVSWQISSQIQSLAAYSLQPGSSVVELMRSGYTKQAVVDIDRDNEKEIVLVQLDAAENNSRAELYDYSDGLMVNTSATPLSRDVTSISAAKVGSLTNDLPALFVSSTFGEYDVQITDIIAAQGGTLTNLTLDEASGMSLSTMHYYTAFTDADGLDINSDGIMELPIPEALPPVGEATQLYQLHWYQYDETGAAKLVYTTFHSYEDGWYFILPSFWDGKITAARRESSANTAGAERAISFYYLPEEDQTQTDADSVQNGGGQEPAPPEPVEFLTIYRLTGSNRTYRASLEGRFVLVETSDVIYAARLRNADWNCGLDSDDVLANFNRIKVNWSAED